MTLAHLGIGVHKLAEAPCVLERKLFAFSVDELASIVDEGHETRDQPVAHLEIGLADTRRIRELVEELLCFPLDLLLEPGQERPDLFALVWSHRVQVLSQLANTFLSIIHLYGSIKAGAC